MSCLRIEDADAVAGSVCFHFLGPKINASLFNLLRHALFKDVAVLAVDTVTFIKYDGPLEPEMISHRIGQLPLIFLTRQTSADDAGGVGGASPPTGATFEISAVSGTDKSGLTWITSSDVTCTSGDARVVHYRSEHERALASSDTGFLIAPLHPGQQIHVKFTARVSSGREATRWISTHCVPKLDPNFHVTVETTGAVSPADALRQALQSTIKKLQCLTIIDLNLNLHCKKNNWVGLLLNKKKESC